MQINRLGLYLRTLVRIWIAPKSLPAPEALSNHCALLTLQWIRLPLSLPRNSPEASNPGRLSKTLSCSSPTSPLELETPVSFPRVYKAHSRSPFEARFSSRCGARLLSNRSHLVFFCWRCLVLSIALWLSPSGSDHSNPILSIKDIQSMKNHHPWVYRDRSASSAGPGAYSRHRAVCERPVVCRSGQM